MQSDARPCKPFPGPCWDPERRSLAHGDAVGPLECDRTAVADRDGGRGQDPAGNLQVFSRPIGGTRAGEAKSGPPLRAGGSPVHTTAGPSST